MSEPRMCAYIPVDAFIEGHGYRVSFVKEGEAGHMPTGDWPYEGKPGQKLPWFWGMTYEEAKAEAEDYNTKLGISPKEAVMIIASSIAAQSREGGRGHDRT